MKYLAFNSGECDYEEFDTIEEAREWLDECFIVEGEGYSQEPTGSKIYKLTEEVSYDVVDKMSNYDSKEQWEEETGMSDEYEEIWKHKFVKVD